MRKCPGKNIPREKLMNKYNASGRKRFDCRRKRLPVHGPNIPCQLKFK